MHHAHLQCSLTVKPKSITSQCPVFVATAKYRHKKPPSRVSIHILRVCVLYRQAYTPLLDGLIEHRCNAYWETVDLRTGVNLHTI